MILNVVYDKSTGEITVSNDEDVSCVVNENEINDTDSEVSFEVAIDLSKYQEFYNDEILEDGDNNE
jgi:hypothetical protein